MQQNDTNPNDIKHNYGTVRNYNQHYDIQQNDTQTKNIQHGVIQHSVIQHTDIQHTDIQFNDTQNSDIKHNYDTVHNDQLSNMQNYHKNVKFTIMTLTKMTYSITTT